MRLTIAALLFSATLVQAGDQSAPNIRGTWDFALSKTHFSEDLLVITPTRITLRNRSEACSADYRVTSIKDGNTYPGGPIDDAGHYTTINLALANSSCSPDVHYFAIAFASGETDAAHFAEFNSAKTLLDFGSLRRVVLPAHAPPFTADEIAIYRDFLLHYPGQLSDLIGMRDTTVAFEASWAFSPELNPPNLEIPENSGRQLPPEIMALTDEKAVTARIAAEGKLDSEWRTHLTLSEIAFDSKHELAAFVFSSLQGKGGTRGTVVYEMKDGQWKRKKRILNVWQG